MMNILFFGDVVGRSGCQVIIEQVPLIRKKMLLDLVIVNVENAAGGFGMTEEICEEFFAVGIDILTSGNHFFDQKQIKDYFDWQHRLIRPLNYPENMPGKGYVLHTLENGQKVIVLNVMGKLFMPSVADPFIAAEKILETFSLKQNGIDAIIVDVHAEAATEKMVLAHMIDGRVSGVFGTHTHIPTADARILAQGTAFMTDVGMCGDYASSTGMNLDICLLRMRNPENPLPPLEPALGPGSLGGVYLETDDETGLALKVQAFRWGNIIESSSFSHL